MAQITISSFICVRVSGELLSPFGEGWVKCTAVVVDGNLDEQKNTILLACVGVQRASRITILVSFG